jgi:hypothetical protein
MDPILPRALLAAVMAASLAACADAAPETSAPPAARALTRADTAPAPDTEAAIAAIRRDFQRIEALGPAARAGEFALEGFSTEGGAAQFFREGGRVVKIAVQHQGEMGHRLEDFYYRGDSLIFVFRRDAQYHRPFGEVRSTEENRFYFDGGRMVRWVGPGGKRIAIHDPEYPAESTNLLALGARLLAAARADSALISAP